jgi:hypothetical protein
MILIALTMEVNKMRFELSFNFNYIVQNLFVSISFL